MEIVRSTSKDLIGILDNLTFVLNQKNPDGTLVPRDPAVAIICDQLVDTLYRNGVKPLGAKPGDKFDPTRHEVFLPEIPEAGYSDIGCDQVCDVVFDGYALGETVLRSARVRIRKVAPLSSAAQNKEA